MITQQTKYLSSLLTGAGLGMVNMVLGIIIGLVYTPFLIRMLGDREYMIIGIASLFVGCFSLLDLGIDSAVSRYFTVHFSKNERKECQELGNTAFALFTSIGLTGFLLIALVGAGLFVLYPEMEDSGLVYTVILINGLAFAVMFATRAFTGIIIGTLRQDLSAGRDIIFRLVGLAATLIVLFLGGRAIALSLVSLVVACLNFFVSFYLVYVAFPGFTWARSFFLRSLIGKLVSFGSFTFLVVLGDAINKRGSLFVFTSMVSLQEAAPYNAVSMNLAGYFTHVMSLIGGGWLITWFTYLYTNNNKELLDTSLRLAYKLCVFSATFILFGLVVWSPDFIVRWLGEKGEAYLVAYPSLVILAAGIWVTQSQAPNTKLLFAMAKHPMLAYLNLAGALGNLTLTIYLTYCGWGLNGIAIGFLGQACLVRGFLIPIYVNRLIGYSMVMYYFNHLRNLIYAAVACIVPYLISLSLLGPTYPRLFLVGILSVLAYAPVVFLLGFNRKEKNKIFGFLRARFARKA